MQGVAGPYWFAGAAVVQILCFGIIAVYIKVPAGLLGLFHLSKTTCLGQSHLQPPGLRCFRELSPVTYSLGTRDYAPLLCVLDIRSCARNCCVANAMLRPSSRLWNAGHVSVCTCRGHAGSAQIRGRSLILRQCLVLQKRASTTHTVLEIVHARWGTGARVVRSVHGISGVLWHILCVNAVIRVAAELPSQKHEVLLCPVLVASLANLMSLFTGCAPLQ